MRSVKLPAFGLAAVGALAITSAASADFVTNGGFETGDFTGWTQGGNLGFTGVTTDPFYVHSGSFGAFLGPVGSDGFLSQTLTGVPAGVSVDIKFWLSNTGGTPNDFGASLNGTSFFSLTDAPGFGMTEYTFNVFTSVADPVLSFNFRQDPGYWGLDDVSANLKTIPLPTTGLMAMAGLGVVSIRRRR